MPGVCPELRMAVVRVAAHQLFVAQMGAQVQVGWQGLRLSGGWGRCCWHLLLVA